MRDIVADPGDKKPIDEFHHDIRDESISTNRSI